MKTLAAQEFSVDYLRTNFLQLLVWEKQNILKTEFEESIDSVLMYFRLSNIYAATSVWSFHGRQCLDTQINFRGRCRVSLINGKFQFGVPALAF